MKSVLKIGLVSCLSVVLSHAQEIKEVDSLDSMFSAGSSSGQIRSMYVGNTNDVEDTSATAIGGNLKYQSASLNGISTGFGFNTSNDIGSMSGEGLERSPELSSSNKEYTVLSEAYLNYSYSNLNIRAGKQVVDTPLADSDDIRMVPNTFEALMATYEVSNITITAGNLQRWQGVDADLDAGWQDTGVNGTWLGGITYSSDIEANAWFFNIDGVANAIYADIAYTQKIGKDISISIAGQVLNETEDENSGVEANIIGVAVALEANGLGLSLAYNQSSKVDAKESFSGFGGGTLFTNMDTMILDEITLDSDADALVLGASYAISDFTFSYAYGDFNAEDSASVKSHIVEQDIVLEYSVNDSLALAAIYVIATDEEDAANPNWNWNRAQVMVTYDF